MLKNFLHDEIGAITIDWVTLTAGLLVVAMAVVFSILSNGWSPVANSINDNLDNAGAELCGGEANCYVISK